MSIGVDTSILLSKNQVAIRVARKEAVSTIVKCQVENGVKPLNR